MRNIKPTADTLANERDQGWGILPDKARNNAVAVVWELNKEAFDTRTVMLKIGDKKAYVDVNELQKLLRWA